MTSIPDSWNRVRVRVGLLDLGARSIHGRLDQTVLIALLREANDILRAEGRDSPGFAEGWEIQAWEPDVALQTGEVTVIAVDPNGIGHDIVALSRGEY